MLLSSYGFEIENNNTHLSIINQNLQGGRFEEKATTQGGQTVIISITLFKDVEGTEDAMNIFYEHLLNLNKEYAPVAIQYDRYYNRYESRIAFQCRDSVEELLNELVQNIGLFEEFINCEYDNILSFLEAIGIDYDGAS